MSIGTQNQRASNSVFHKNITAEISMGGTVGKLNDLGFQIGFLTLHAPASLIIKGLI